MKEDKIYDMTHDAWVCAFHEAGHAVLIVAVGWGPKVEEVVITPETAQGGYVRLNDHKGRLTPKDEILRELAKNLAGPTAQVLFADQTINEPYRKLFKKSILEHFKTVDDINNSNCPAWKPDLQPYLAMVQHYPDFCDDHFRAERFVRLLFSRPSVIDAIKSVAEHLHADHYLSGDRTREIVKAFLQAEDYVGEDDILRIAG